MGPASAAIKAADLSVLPYASASMSETPMQIADRCVASFHYTLTNAKGEVLDSSAGHEPLAYLHGGGNIVPGLEKAMTGRSAGDKFNVEVKPEEGYGVRDPKLVQVVPRRAFKGVRELKAGMRFQTDGQHSV